MVLWKYSLEVANRELELIKKKKQALDNMFNTGQISQSTYDYLNKDITDALSEIEIHQKSLADKITARANELEKQLNTLEVFLANLEIHYSAGEIGEELYNSQGNAISLGIESTKEELMNLKDSLSEFISEVETSPESNNDEYKKEEETMDVTPKESTEDMHAAQIVLDETEEQQDI